MRGLGELETAVMGVLWDAEQPLTVRQARERLDTGRPLAYTTVMTVLDNLYRKSWVARDLAGKAYRYRPAATREQAAAAELREVLDASGNPDAVLLHFAGSISEHQSRILREALRHGTAD